MSAMELLDSDSCVCFLFTHSVHRDFKFCIGVGNVKFERQDPIPNKKLNKSKPEVQNNVQNINSLNRPV